MTDEQLVALMAAVMRAGALSSGVSTTTKPMQYVNDSVALLTLARQANRGPDTPTPEPEQSAMVYDKRCPPFATVMTVTEALEANMVDLDTSKAFWGRMLDSKSTIRYDDRFNIRGTPNGVAPPDATHVIVFP